MREQKGFTQVHLSEISGLSLRTIQRLEANNQPPQGHSLRVLAESFGLEPDSLYLKFSPDESISDKDITSIKTINLSILAFLGVPFGNVILPFIIWRKYRESVIVDEVGKKIINGQILWSILLCLSLCIAPFLHFSFLDFKSPVLIVLLIMMLLNIFLVLDTASHLHKGEIDFLNLPIRLL